jgi:eukaryotic-like serine/threonine-protein kinase
VVRKNRAETPGPRLIAGRYELRERLGRGATAVVWLARDLRYGRQVAVKELAAHLAGDPVFQARFRQEVHAVACLDHPSIVAIYDTGEDPIEAVMVPYLVMEYVDGKTLQALLRTAGRLPPEQALQIAAHTLAALEHSHAKGIIHRDIKPGNVMLTTTNTVKVMDFGIATRLCAPPPASAQDMPAGATNSRDLAANPDPADTESSELVGTVHYLSPEQARGEQVDGRSDIYSVGCLLYELLTGKPPFTADAPVAVLYQHMVEKPTPPSRLHLTLDPAIDAVVLKALAKRRVDRYHRAADMRHAVEHICGRNRLCS